MRRRVPEPGSRQFPITTTGVSTTRHWDRHVTLGVPVATGPVWGLGSLVLDCRCKRPLGFTGPHGSTNSLWRDDFSSTLPTLVLT